MRIVQELDGTLVKRQMRGHLQIEMLERKRISGLIVGSMANVGMENKPTVMYHTKSIVKGMSKQRQHRQKKRQNMVHEHDVIKKTFILMFYHSNRSIFCLCCRFFPFSCWRCFDILFTIAYICVRRVVI